ncbi:MAG: hypothetical protein K0S39_2463 [Paenibacillus sp.]|jgi:hypothetical protein|nr:hypothetical protein [Paenibacillus sp.]
MSAAGCGCHKKGRSGTGRRTVTKPRVKKPGMRSGADRKKVHRSIGDRVIDRSTGTRPIDTNQSRGNRTDSSYGTGNLIGNRSIGINRPNQSIGDRLIGNRSVGNKSCGCRSNEQS